MDFPPTHSPADAAALLRELGLPLIVDLDGTLIETDTLAILRRRVRRRPWLRPGHRRAISTSKQAEKLYLFERLPLDVARLPYRTSVLELIRETRAVPLPTALATGSSIDLARAVAHHLDLFDEVHGSVLDLNLTGPRKADALVERYGAGRFAYVGDKGADMPVWRCAALGISVDPLTGRWLDEDLAERVVVLAG